MRNPIDPRDEDLNPLDPDDDGESNAKTQPASGPNTERADWNAKVMSDFTTNRFVDRN